MPLYDNLGREIAHEPKPRRKSVPRPRNLKHQRRKPTSETSPLPKSFEVRLTARHNINGEFYGPGMVTVKSKPLADTLLEQERNAARADAQFAGTRAALIGPGRMGRGFRTQAVAPEMFDMAAETLLPFGVVNRNTGVFSRDRK